jgi:hypothetical protein
VNATTECACPLEITDLQWSADQRYMRMARILYWALCVAALALLASASRSQNSLPVLHREPVTIRILNGKDGAPLAHVHVVFVAGYDDQDLRLGLWSEEAITNAKGQASLPDSLKNFSFVAVWVAKRKLCAQHGHALGADLDNVRNQGLSTTNRCGNLMFADKPGVLTVFAQAHAEDLPSPIAPFVAPAAKPAPAPCRSKRTAPPKPKPPPNQAVRYQQTAG